MGNRFFQIAGVVSYGVAALTLVIAIIAGLMAASGYFGGVDKEIESPDLSLEEYKAEVAPEKEAEQAEEQQPAGERQEPVNPDADKVDKLVKDYVILIWDYNEVTNQGDPKPDGIKQWIYRATHALRDEKERAEFLESLNASFEETLVEPAKDGDSEILAQNIPGVDPEENKYVHWDSYLEWYTSQYMETYREGLNRIEKETREQKKAQAAAIGQAIVAGAAFAIFILATLILLLVQIERNTRNQADTQNN